MMIKPLLFSGPAPGRSHLTADCGLGRYIVFPVRLEWAWGGPDSEVARGVVSTCDHAIAAATRDYENRICESLNVPRALVTGGVYSFGDLVRKKSGGQWHGAVVGFYHTTLTQHGVCVESMKERGSVQLYPQVAMEDWDG